MFFRHLSTGGLAYLAIPEHTQTLRITARRQWRSPTMPFTCCAFTYHTADY